jgi:hypothetical protein
MLWQQAAVPSVHLTATFRYRCRQPLREIDFIPQPNLLVDQEGVLRHKSPISKKHGRLRAATQDGIGPAFV